MLTEVTDTYALGSPQVSGRVALTFSATRRNLEDVELFAGPRARKTGSGKAGAQRARRRAPG